MDGLKLGDEGRRGEDSSGNNDYAFHVSERMIWLQKLTAQRGRRSRTFVGEIGAIGCVAPVGDVDYKGKALRESCMFDSCL